MIFFLIAGTATPAFLLSAAAGLGLACLIIMWVLTLTAAAVRLAWPTAPELVAGAVFTGLGSAGGSRCRGYGSTPAPHPACCYWQAASQTGRAGSRDHHLGG
jgi:hypothetical protein